LHIAPGGSARGEVRYGSLQVDRGGVIDGSTLHGEDTHTVEPTSDSDAPASAPPPLPATARASIVS
jgi:cytoskeletal protein CcmA (bactofilin family)